MRSTALQGCARLRRAHQLTKRLFIDARSASLAGVRGSAPPFKGCEDCKLFLRDIKMKNLQKNYLFYFSLLTLILLIRAVWMGYVILNGEIGLNPDEAQYWTWSQSLDWGYYSKPPAIAWQIWLGTQLFGDTELGVRFISIILSMLLSLSTLGIAAAAGAKPLTSFWAGLIMAFSPLGILSSLFATTDIGMVLFWALASMVLMSALRQHIAPNYYLIGFLIFCGALFKWPIYLFWVLIILSAVIYRFLLSKHLIGGMLVSALGLFPSVIWNVQHEWATFRHVTSTVVGREYPKPNFFEFIASQILLLSPIFFALFIFGLWYLIKHRKTIPAPFFFCGASSALILTIYSFMAIFQKMQGNWCIFIYPAAIVFLSWYACEQLNYGKAWLRAGLVLSLLFSLFMINIPYIQAHSLFSRHQIPFPWNSFKNNIGWNNLSSVLQKSGYDVSKDFLFGDKYQMSSILSFYSQEQKRAYFLNLQGIRKNQFSFWPGLEKQIGKTGYFVVAEHHPHLEKMLSQDIEKYQNLLNPFFQKVEFLGISPLFLSYGTMKKGALIYKCIDYNGKQPPETFSY